MSFSLNVKPSTKTSPIPGYLPHMPPVTIQELSTAGNRDAAKTRQMMAVAYAPGKQLFMTAFMLWMSGSSLNIFSIMMTGMALWSPIRSLFSIASSFGNFEELSADKVLRAKAIFVALNGIGLAMGFYKLGNMGLLPLYSSDWIPLLDEVVMSPA